MRTRVELRVTTWDDDERWPLDHPDPDDQDAGTTVVHAAYMVHPWFGDVVRLAEDWTVTYKPKDPS